MIKTIRLLFGVKQQIANGVFEEEETQDQMEKTQEFLTQTKNGLDKLEALVLNGEDKWMITHIKNVKSSALSQLER